MYEKFKNGKKTKMDAILCEILKEERCDAIDDLSEMFGKILVEGVEYQEYEMKVK